MAACLCLRWKSISPSRHHPLCRPNHTCRDDKFPLSRAPSFALPIRRNGKCRSVRHTALPRARLPPELPPVSQGFRQLSSPPEPPAGFAKQGHKLSDPSQTDSSAVEIFLPSLECLAPP